MRRAVLAGCVLLLLLPIGCAKPKSTTGQPYDPSTATAPNSAPSSRRRESYYGWGATAQEMLARPLCVAVASDGTVYTISTTGGCRFIGFGPDGRTPRIGDIDTRMKRPAGLAIAPDDVFYVADGEGHAVLEYAAAGGFVRSIKFDDAPSAITASTDRLVVATAGNVAIGDRTGKRLAVVGTRGSGPGQFDLPSGVAIDAVGNLYVADSHNYRVQAVTQDGTQLWEATVPVPVSIGSSVPGAVAMPTGIALDSDGYLFVPYAVFPSDGEGVEAIGGGVAVFNADGRLLGTLGESGHDEGQFYLPGQASERAGTLAIADLGNNRLQVFEATP